MLKNLFKSNVAEFTELNFCLYTHIWTGRLDFSEKSDVNQS